MTKEKLEIEMETVEPSTESKARPTSGYAYEEDADFNAPSFDGYGYVYKPISQHQQTMFGKHCASTKKAIKCFGNLAFCLLCCLYCLTLPIAITGAIYLSLTEGKRLEDLKQEDIITIFSIGGGIGFFLACCAGICMGSFFAKTGDKRERDLVRQYELRGLEYRLKRDRSGEITKLFTTDDEADVFAEDKKSYRNSQP